MSTKISYLFKLLNSNNTYTCDATTIATGDGVYSADEWGETRRRNYEFYHLSSEKNYLRMIFEEPSTIAGAVALQNNFDFSNYVNIGDIGGVPFSQAWTLQKLNPNLNFTLTDYDKTSVEAHLMCPPFHDARLITLDAKGHNFEQLNNCDLLMMWGVDYALDDEDLTRLFKYIKCQGVSLLMATVKSNEPALRHIFRLIRSESQRIRGKARMHGVLRNELYFEKLCQLSEVSIKTITAIGSYHFYKIN